MLQMFRFLITSLLCIFCLINIGNAQDDCPPEIADNPLIFKFQNIPSTILPGDQICTDMAVCGFTNIASIQFVLTYDPSVIQLETDPIDQGSLIGAISTNTQNSDLGLIFFNWFNLNGTGETIPDNTVLSTICFTVVGSPGDNTLFDLIGYQNTLEEYFIINPDDSQCIYPPENVQVTLSNPITISCDALFVDATYCDVNGGLASINVSICGGTAPYSYELEDDSGIVATGTSAVAFEDIILDNLSPGNYIITVRDAAGGIAFFPGGSQAIEIGLNDPLSIENFWVTQPKCNGFDGHLGVDATGGQGPYFFEWDIGVFSDTISRLPEGTYTVTVTDNFGCTVSSSGTLFTPAIEIDNLMIEDATCNGSSDGTVLLTLQGGTPFSGGEYMFEQQLSTEFAMNNLDPGVFEIDVEDANGCRNEVFFTIESEKVVQLDFVSFDTIQCYGEGGGFMIETEALSQTSPVLFTDEFNDLVFGAIASISSLGQINSVMPIPAGEYLLSFVTADQCLVDTTIVFTQPDTLTIDVDQEVNPGCSGDDGAISLTINGGTPGYMFNWDNGDTSEDLTGLAGGAYNLVVTDANQCLASASFNLLSSGTLVIDAFPLTQPGCGNNSFGEAVVDVLSSGSNFSYVWTDEADVTVGTDSIVTNLTPGMYFVEVDNNMGCVNNDTVVIEQVISDISLSAISNDPDCIFGTLGSITLMVNGGDMPYVYDWSHDDTIDGPIANNLVNGSYDIVVTDDVGCSVDTTIVISPSDEILVSVNNIQNTQCYDSFDGSAVAEVTNIVGANVYDYIWSSSSDNENDVLMSTASNLQAGENWVVAILGGCMSDTVTFMVNSPDSILLNEDLTNITPAGCGGESTGAIELIVDGGVGTLNYTWDPNVISGSTGMNIPQGMYSVTVEDANLCSNIFNIEIPGAMGGDPLLVSVNADETFNISCLGPNSGIISLNVEGGDGNFTYDWSPDISDTSIASNLTAGLYEVTVSDSNGCTAATSYEVLQNFAAVQASVASIDPILCNSDSTEICIETATGGTGAGYTYSVNNSVSIPIDSCLTVFAGSYQINVFDSDGCPADNNPILIDIIQPDPISVDIVEDEILFTLGDDNVLISANTSSIIDSLVWTPLDSLSCINDPCTDIEVAPTQDTEYSITIIDENGCEAQDQVLVKVVKIRNVFRPNIFDPEDPSGNNNLFFPLTGNGVSEVSKFQIYDRWGNVIHSRSNILQGQEELNAWDGNCGSSLCQAGVYVYLLEVLFVDGETEIFTGSITMIR